MAQSLVTGQNGVAGWEQQTAQSKGKPEKRMQCAIGWVPERELVPQERGQ